MKSFCRKPSFKPCLESLEERCLLESSPFPVPVATPTPMTSQQVIAAQMAFNSSASPSFLSSTQPFVQQSLAVLMWQNSTEAASLIASGVKLGGIIDEGAAIVLETLGEAAILAAPLAETPPLFVAQTAANLVVLMQPKLPELNMLAQEAQEPATDIAYNSLFYEALGKFVELWVGADSQQLQSQPTLTSQPTFRPPVHPFPFFGGGKFAVVPVGGGLFTTVPVA